MTLQSRYIVHADRVEEVSDRTSRRHRVLTVDNDGDALITNDAGTVIAALSRAELAHLFRQAFRASITRRFRL